jgi:hypothetical protein
MSLLDPARQAPTAMSRHLSSEAVREADLQLNLGLAGLSGGEGKRDGEAAAKARAAGLSVGQAEAVGALCSTRRLEIVIGPAGIGEDDDTRLRKRAPRGRGPPARRRRPDAQGRPGRRR